MRYSLLCKRFYTNKDLISERFGRLYHLPRQLGLRGHKGLALALDYRGRRADRLSCENTDFLSLPLRTWRGIGDLCSLRRRIEEQRPEVMIASGDSHIGYLGYRLARRLGIPFVFDVYDDYTAFSAARLPGMKALFRHTIRRAALVTTASEPLRTKLLPLNGNSLVVENGYDPDLFRPMPASTARQALGLPAAGKVVGFFGAIDRNRGIETLIAAVNGLRREHPDLRLLLAGRNAAGLDLGRSWIDYRGAVPQARVPELINACDVAAIPYHRDKQVDVSNACKMAEYIACRRPIVATEVSNHATFLAEAPQGLCRPNDADDLARAIAAQLNKPELVPPLTRLTWESLGHRLEQSLVALTSVARH